MGLITENPLPETSVGSFNTTNLTLNEICLYYSKYNVNDPELKEHFDRFCGSTANILASAESSNFLSLFWGTILLLKDIGVQILKNIVMFPFYVYEMLYPLASNNPVFEYSLYVLTSSLIFLQYGGFIVALVQRIRGR